MGAAEPPERPRAGVRVTVGQLMPASTTNTVIEYAEASGLTLTPWQAVVIHYAYRTKRLLHRGLR